MKIIKIKNFSFGKLAMMFMLASLIFNGCSKEEFGVYNEDFENLTTSYFNFQDSVIVLEHSDVLENIIQKEESTLTLNDADIFSDLSVGSVLVSTMDTPKEDFIFRKIINLSSVGGQIIAETEIATLYDAYKSFYFNSENSSNIQTRDEKIIFFDLKDLKSPTSTINFESTLNNVFTSVEDALNMVLPPAGTNGLAFLSKISVDVDFTGLVRGESIHPYDQFILNNPSIPLFDNVDKSDRVDLLNGLLDSDGDKICDLVEDYYQTEKAGPGAKEKFPVLTQIRIDDFTMSFKPSIEFGKKFSLDTKQLLQPGQTFPANEVEVALNDMTKVKIDLSESPLEDINYVPVATHPAFPVFGIAFAWHKLATFDGNISLNLAAELFSDPTDVVLGVYDFGNLNIEPEVRLERKNESGDIQSFTFDTFISDNVDLNLSYVVNAQAEFRLGVGLGLAIFAGEQNFALVSAGGMLNPYIFLEGNASLGATYRSLIRNGSSVIFDPNNYFGFGCVKAGIGLNAYAFTDGKDPSNFLNILDTKLALFDEKKDFLGLLTGGQFCIGVLPCDNVTIEKVEIEESGSANDFLLKIKAISDDAGHPKYKVRLLNGSEVVETYPLESNKSFTFGTEEELFINSMYLADYLSGASLSLEIKVEDKDPECRKQIFNGNIFVNHCVNEVDPFETQMATFETKKYFTNVQARAFCLNKGKPMITRDQLRAKIENGEICVYPSGFIATNDGKLNNITETYVWTLNPSFPTVATLTVVKPIRQIDGTYTYEIENGSISTIGSASAQLKCKCAD